MFSANRDVLILPRSELHGAAIDSEARRRDFDAVAAGSESADGEMTLSVNLDSTNMPVDFIFYADGRVLEHAAFSVGDGTGKSSTGRLGEQRLWRNSEQENAQAE